MEKYEIKEIVQKQRQYFLTGHTLSYGFRKKNLVRLYNIITRNEDLIYKALYKDMRKPYFESFVSEIGFVLNELKFVIKNLKKWMNFVFVKTPIIHFKAQSFVYNQPYGVTLILSPWNYPFHLTMMPLLGAVAAGNTVILKPSEVSIYTSKLITKLINDNFDSCYITAIEGDKNIAEYLLDEKFDKIFYTGNTIVGKIVMEKAAKHLTPVTLELGGKSPAIIFESANLKVAAKRLIWGKFFNAGQTCVAPDYSFVESKIYNQFVKLLIKETKRYISSKYFLNDYARIINEKHFDRLLSFIKEEKVLFTKPSRKDDLLIYPTIIETDINDFIMKEEIFGPILPVLKFSQYSVMRNFITSGPKPLALYIFSENKKTQMKVLKDIQSGGVTINDTLVHLSSSHLPFGGILESGMGSYHGRHSFDTFSHKRAVMNRDTFFDFPLRYPPYKGKLFWVKKLF